MKVLLLFFLARPVAAETLPYIVDDPATREVVNYLHQEIRKDRQQRKALLTTAQTFADITVTSLNAALNFSSAAVTWSNAAAALAVCYATTTLTARNGWVWVEFTGAAENTVAAEVDHRWGFLVNAAGVTSYPTGYSATTGAGQCDTDTNTAVVQQCALSGRVLYNPGTSETSYCLTAYSSTATGDSSGGVVNTFVVYEAR